MPAINPGEIWSVDFGFAAKVRPALLLTGNPAVEELDLVTVLLHTTSLRGHRWELSIPKPFLKPGAFHLQQIQSVPTVKLERKLGVLTVKNLNPAVELNRRTRRKQSMNSLDGVTVAPRALPLGEACSHPNTDPTPSASVCSACSCSVQVLFPG